MEKPAPSEYPLHDLIRRRWSPLAFSERPVEPGTLALLLEAAHWAPSSFNEQPWRFLVATRDDPAEFERMLSCLVEGNQAWARTAPVLMLSVAHLLFERNAKSNRHAFHDVGQAAAVMTVQAMALGIFIHQMAGILVDRAREVFAIPEGYEAVAGIALGYMGDPAVLPEKLRERHLGPRSRRPLRDLVFSGSWGKTAPFVPKESAK